MNGLSLLLFSYLKIQSACINMSNLKRKMSGDEGSQKGTFSAEEDELYLELLNNFGKPTNSNPNLCDTTKLWLGVVVEKILCGI